MRGVVVTVPIVDRNTRLASILEELAIPFVEFQDAITLSFEETNSSAKVLILYGSAGETDDTERLFVVVTQSGHSFTQGTCPIPVYYVNDLWVRASSVSLDTQALGVVTNVSGDTFEVTFRGKAFVEDHGLDTDGFFWLALSGLITEIEPESGVSQPVLHTLDENFVLVDVERARLVGIGLSDTYKVRVTTVDTTPDFLSGKIVAGSNISVSVLSPGGDESLSIAAAQANGYSSVLGNTGSASAISPASSFLVSGVASIVTTVSDGTPDIVSISGDALLPRDGSRAMTGTLSLGGNSISSVGYVDGRDVSVDGATLDAHVASGLIHFTETDISHLNIQDIGTTTHSGIDVHIADDSIHSPEFRTTEPIEGTIDPVNGVSPPAGTIIRSQADYDALGAPLKYWQDSVEILPHYVDYAVKWNMVAGEHLIKPGYSYYSIGNFSTTARKHEDYWDEYFYDPYISYVGATTTIESGISGTLDWDAENNCGIFTRTSGSWVAGELVGKFLEFTSGGATGQRIVIFDNTTTVASLAEAGWDSGSHVAKTFESATTLLTSLNGSTKTTYGIYGAGTNSSYSVWFAFCNIGKPTLRSGINNFYYSGAMFDYCTFYGPFRSGDRSDVSLIGCVFNFASDTIHYDGGLMIDGSMNATMGGCLVKGTLAASKGLMAFRTASLIKTFGSNQIVPSAGFTGSCLYFVGGGGVNCQSETNIWGNGSCIGIDILGVGSDLPRFEDSDYVTVNNCATAIRVRRAVFQGKGFFPSVASNTIGWSISNGGEVIQPDPSNISASTSISIDGENFTYDSLDSVGDEIRGQYGSLMKRSQ